MTKRKDRRTSQRHHLKTPVLYRVAGSTSESSWRRGRVLDMSGTGLLMGHAEGLAAGSTFELAMDWPGLYHDKPAMRLYLLASVVRVDPRGKGLRILHHEFREVPVRMRHAERDLAVA